MFPVIEAQDTEPCDSPTQTNVMIWGVQVFASYTVKNDVLY